MILDLLDGFVRELRAAGIPVSMVEAIDALQALEQIDIADRSQFKTALGATMVKNERHHDAFETVFDVYFGFGALAGEQAPRIGVAEPGRGTGGLGGEADLDALFEALIRALLAGDFGAVRALARRSVTSLAGMEPGRPVGGAYYLYRVLRAVPTERLLAALMNTTVERRLSPLEELLLKEDFERRIETFRGEVEAEIRRRLVADRGPEAVARTLRRRPDLLERADLTDEDRRTLEALQRAGLDAEDETDA